MKLSYIGKECWPNTETGFTWRRFSPIPNVQNIPVTKPIILNRLSD
jgi:hypothetical protein